MLCRLLLFVIAASALIAAQTDVRELYAQRVLAGIREIELRSGGVIGVAARDLDSGIELNYQADAVFTQASVIKVPILWRLFADIDAGMVDPAKRIPLQARDAAGGSGALQMKLRALGDGTLELPVAELALLMIRDSDNSATNKLIELVGMERVNALLQENGFPQTRLQRSMMDGTAVREDRENISTPAEMVHMMRGLAEGQWLSRDSTAELLRLLGSVNGSVRRALPADARVASKTGGVPGVYGEAALVTLGDRRYVLSIMATFLDPLAENPVGAVAAAVHRVFERLAQSNRYGHRLD